ncbi:PqqD family protein [Hydrogenimonas urashimensis]|uniref:PqqD family protein n=1 Tax=Hydrogenimonas urashimensis TaxID=2740515 RepID=UPI00191696D3|nr:PqqD family protein [Hydrogenimonas urashimensis]
MQTDQCYQPNVPKVVDEIFEDEIIVINFDNGDYFSLRKSAIDIWKGIKEGQSVGSILENLQDKYEAEAEEIRNSIDEMIGTFLKENLISEADASTQKKETSDQKTGGKVPFQPPVFEKFTDMNDLLVLDPVHDVDESGWPHVNPNTQAK